jgi:hypothetical protein
MGNHEMNPFVNVCFVHPKTMSSDYYFCTIAILYCGLMHPKHPLGWQKVNARLGLEIGSRMNMASRDGINILR